MKSLGYDIREEDPFAEQSTISYSRITSPYVMRLKLMWNKMQDVVIFNFPEIKHSHTDIEACLKDIDAQYKLDAYHSLSIEGYKVTDELIERVKSGNWKPDEDSSDAEQRNAMAARGSMHTPLNPEAVREAMPVLFELLKNELDARVRTVLGHFIFVYIHPYMDGNGRIARFLMNTMLISGGYDWTIIPVERRQEYMAALENASVNENITDFTLFLRSLVEE
jgi:Fic family protein